MKRALRVLTYSLLVLAALEILSLAFVFRYRRIECSRALQNLNPEGIERYCR